MKLNPKLLLPLVTLLITRTGVAEPIPFFNDLRLCYVGFSDRLNREEEKKLNLGTGRTIREVTTMTMQEGDKGQKGLLAYHEIQHFNETVLFVASPQPPETSNYTLYVFTEGNSYKYDLGSKPNKNGYVLTDIKATKCEIPGLRLKTCNARNLAIKIDESGHWEALQRHEINDNTIEKKSGDEMKEFSGSLFVSALDNDLKKHLDSFENKTKLRYKDSEKSQKYHLVRATQKYIAACEKLEPLTHTVDSAGSLRQKILGEEPRQKHRPPRRPGSGVPVASTDQQP